MKRGNASDIIVPAPRSRRRRYRQISCLNNDIKKCGVFALPSGISFFVENKPSSDSAWRSPPWAHICMTEQVRKRRSQVTYALGIASSSGQGNKAVASKPLPVFRTRENVRSAPSKTASYGARNLVETREEVLRKDALEETFVASRKRFLAMAYSILRNREDAEDETLEFIDGKLGKLKPLLRQAFTMAYLDELSGSEACAMLGVSAGIFKARLFRAKRKVFNQTDRDLVAPIHKKTLSPSEFLKRK